MQDHLGWKPNRRETLIMYLISLFFLKTETAVKQWKHGVCVLNELQENTVSTPKYSELESKGWFLFCLFFGSFNTWHKFQDISKVT